MAHYNTFPVSGTGFAFFLRHNFWKTKKDHPMPTGKKVGKDAASHGSRLAALVCVMLVGFCLSAAPAQAVRLKDLASVKGVRNNQLVGYGIVVGLNGTGDSNKATFTGQSLSNMLNNMGAKVDPESTRVKNIAGVMVTATLPPFFKAGQSLDVAISSVGDATSLQGGTLLATPLKGLDNNVCAIAQGQLSVGGVEPGGGVGRQRRHLTVARIAAGASVEKEVPLSFANREKITISLAAPDVTTISLMKTAIDAHLGGNYATARDGGSVEVKVPDKFRNQEVALLAALENIEIVPERRAKVVLNERTGTVVMGDMVTISQLALSHGNLSLQVTPPGSSPVDQVRAGQKVVTLPTGVSLGEVVRALNSVGVAPRELIAIFQAIKAAGALQAELEII